MSRPPLGNRAMTPAERQRRRRERRRAMLETEQACARYEQAAVLTWVEDHPGHTRDDFEWWGGCGATPEQSQHWHEWDLIFFLQHFEIEPAAVADLNNPDKVDALEAIGRRRKLAAMAPPVGQSPELQELVAAWNEIDVLRRYIAKLEKKLAGNKPRGRRLSVNSSKAAARDP
jgi:hypothetical protein